MITVFLFSYNHFSFIEKAIESILVQVTTFKFKIIICDDCSSDNTQNIIKRYKKNFPDRISLILRKKNLGYQKSILYALKDCDTKYTAILEGDDFWTDSNKLQKQVTYLEQNPDCSLCTHWIQAKDEASQGISKNRFSGKNKPTSLTSNLMFDLSNPRSPMATGHHILSWVFRSKLMKLKPPSWIFRVKGLDDVLFILMLEHGYCYCIPKTMGTYRINSKSSWAPLNQFAKEISHLHYLIRVKKSFRQYSKKIRKVLHHKAHRLSFMEFNTKQSSAIVLEVVKLVKRDPYISLSIILLLIKTCAHSISRKIFLSDSKT